MASYVTYGKDASESDIQATICEYLERKGYRFWRQNTAGIYDTRREVFRKPNKYSVNGVSDIIVLSEGKAYFIEVKTATGRQSEDQKAFEEFVESAGCEYILARCLEDVMEAGF